MNKKRRQLHKHIEQRGNHLVTVTPQLIKYWWNVCNEAVFDGILNDPKKMVARPMHPYAQCELNRVVEIDGWNTDQFTIEVDTRKPMTRRLFLAILIHEMIHQWEWYLGPGSNNLQWSGHGKPFNKWARKASRRSGLKIERDYYEEDYVTDGQRQLHKRRHKSPKRSRAR